jgi:hypothetical protein
LRRKPLVSFDAEQQLKLAVMNSVGDTIRHIIAPPPMAFQNMTISDIIALMAKRHAIRSKESRKS